MGKHGNSDDLLSRPGWGLALPSTLFSSLDPPWTRHDAARTPAQPADPTTLAELRRRAATDCAVLAREAARLWRLPEAEQIPGTAVLAERVVELSIPIAAMAAPDAVQLARLIVRHYKRLPHRTRHTVALLLAFADLRGGPKLADLLVEVAASGNSELGFTLDLALGTIDEQKQLDLHRTLPGLGARLAEVLDTSPSAKGQNLAATMLAWGHFTEALPALGRALRHRRLDVRARALAAWLRQAPDDGASDVLFLLEDAVVHPLPVRSDLDDVLYYETMLHRAVKVYRPGGGDVLLRRIVTGDCAYRRGDRPGLDEGWALATLAAGYPDVALPILDEWLRRPETLRRLEAVEALGALSAERAGQRLLRAAADPSFEVAERARDTWMERFGTACPLARADTSVLCLRLLTEPPSVALGARLAAWRSSQGAARETLVRALLGAAPEREALVLLLYALGDSLVGIDSIPNDLPGLKENWALLLIERFGPAAFEGVLWLSERFAPRWYEDWLAIASKLVIEAQVVPGRIELPPDARAHVIGYAARRFRASREDHEALKVLADLGAPVELEEPLWSLAFGEPGFGSWLAVEALAKMEDAGRLDDRIPPAVEETLRARRYEILGSVGVLAIRRNVEVAVAQLTAALTELAKERGVDAFKTIAHWLQKAGRLPAGWHDRALLMPESPQFAVAADVVDRDFIPAGAARALESALASAARRGASRVEAAIALLRIGALSPDDPRIEELLRLASRRYRGRLLNWIRAARGERLA